MNPNHICMKCGTMLTVGTAPTKCPVCSKPIHHSKPKASKQALLSVALVAAALPSLRLVVMP